MVAVDTNHHQEEPAEEHSEGPEEGEDAAGQVAGRPGDGPRPADLWTMRQKMRKGERTEGRGLSDKHLIVIKTEVVREDVLHQKLGAISVLKGDIGLTTISK